MRRRPPDVGDILFTGYLAVLLALTMPPVWLVVMLVPAGAGAHRLVRAWARFIVRASGCRVRASGIAHLRGVGAAMLVSNHTSYIDSIVLMAIVPADFRYVAEHGVNTWPLVGSAMRRAGHLTVDRGSRTARLACAAAMVDALRRGGSLLVYPEGRRSRNEGLLPFHLGAFRAAVTAGRPVVPITIRGTAAIAEPGRWLGHRGAIEVIVHPPIEPIADDRPEMVRLRASARERIEGAL